MPHSRLSNASSSSSDLKATRFGETADQILSEHPRLTPEGLRGALAFAVEVSGKGMPAALLASNIQAPVRSISGTDTDPLTLAHRINSHLSRYTPSNRFATAVFMLLSRDSGELAYVNCGHNAPMLCGPGSTTFLEATGPPLGLFSGATYEARLTTIAPGDILLVFTDGLTDSVSGESAQDRLRTAVTSDVGSSLSNLINLVEPVLNEDDITILLVKRTANSAYSEPVVQGALGR
jgi:sigma-B regulation protein RsbU (phosphoserine phosphatase)